MFCRNQKMNPMVNMTQGKKGHGPSTKRTTPRIARRAPSSPAPT